ncbi:MAG: P1 family peptidase [Betaproteobacteria bacterium]|nr:P1 family peptidase [Betaproteobacteria bacterium]
MLTTPSSAFAGTRARELGVPFPGETGEHNAITDVPGVTVGFTTLIEGEGKLVAGKGPVRTGVTVVLPRGVDGDAPVFAATFALNGAGELTGATHIEEYGLLEGPIALTNSQSVGTVRDAIANWLVTSRKWQLCCLPVVGETWDGVLNDVNGFHVQARHVLAAIENARAGPLAEGNVGGGTGMVAFGFKAGTGTSSRRVRTGGHEFTVGVLVQANMGRREQLVVAGVPVGREFSTARVNADGRANEADAGSILILIATDAPLLPHQLKRIAKRAAMGLAHTGAIGGDSSGDIFLAFSTGNANAVGLQNGASGGVRSHEMLSNNLLNPLFQATIEATEEAIINALVAARTMTGIDGRTIEALPHGRLRDILARYRRLSLP